MPHFVYLLRNTFGKQYVGQTTNVEARLNEHNAGSVIATKHGKPWYIEWFCQFREKHTALLFEKYLKSGSGRAFRDRHLISLSADGSLPTPSLKKR